MAKIFDFETGRMVADFGNDSIFRPLPEDLLGGDGACTNLELDVLEASLYEAEGVFFNTAMPQSQHDFFKLYIDRVLVRIEASNAAAALMGTSNHKPTRTAS